MDSIDLSTPAKTGSQLFPRHPPQSINREICFPQAKPWFPVSLTEAGKGKKLNNLSFYPFHLESEALVEEVIECFQNSVSREELHFLLTNHEAWERFVAKATLSR